MSYARRARSESLSGIEDPDMGMKDAAKPCPQGDFGLAELPKLNDEEIGCLSIRRRTRRLWELMKVEDRRIKRRKFGEMIAGQEAHPATLFQRPQSQP